uniref:Uncharacterized protein n=1 Tax=Triticum urartu TaxID=4572 RepID=A0A8R7VJ69_TRIUA
ALGRDAPLEAPPGGHGLHLLRRRHHRVVPPLPQHVPEVADLVRHADAAVGVHGARPRHVVAEQLAEAAEVRRVEELDAYAQVAAGAGELVLDVVEDGLLVVLREPPPRRPPLPQHLHRPVRRLHVVEPRVGPVAEVVRVAGEHVAGRRHVRVQADVPERVPEPQDVHVREQEAVAELEHALLELQLGPHQLHVRVAHEVARGAQVHGRLRRRDEIAEPVHGPAVAVGHGVHGDDEEVVQEVVDLLAGEEALTEEAQKGARPREGLVHRRDDHRPVVRGHHGQKLSQT